MMGYSQADYDLMYAVGGRPYTNRTLQFQYAPNALNFGWIPLGDRTQEEEEATQKAIAAMPEFRIVGNDTGKTDEGKVCLWELWKHPTTTTALGFTYTGTHQLTGSCVGAGGGNTHFTLAAMEVIRLGDPEQIIVPFWLFTYGKSRNRAGLRGRGEGSMGAAYAEAARLDGIFPANLEGLPSFTKEDGLVWGRDVELEWSDGAQHPAKWNEAAKRHLVKTTAVCKSADNVRDAIRNGYPVSTASDWGGLMQCPTESGVLLNRRSGTWMHQQSIHAWWDHPQLGEIFWIQNQWGLTAHGSDPAGGPGGGYWVKKNEIEYQCRNGEVFAFSQFDGFPAQTLSWWI